MTCKAYAIGGDPDEAIAAIERADEIDRAACRRHVERHFTIDRMADQYFDLYRQLLGG